MFYFITHYLGFLKHVPGLILLFDTWLKIWSMIICPQILDSIDAIETEVLNWDNTASIMHKYGGMQLNLGCKELGHIHSNGLVDILLSRSLKQQMMNNEGRVQHHHLFKRSGWISFYMRPVGDEAFVIYLFKQAYQLHTEKDTNCINPKRKQ